MFAWFTFGIRPNRADEHGSIFPGAYGAPPIARTAIVQNDVASTAPIADAAIDDNLRAVQARGHRHEEVVLLALPAAHDDDVVGGGGLRHVSHEALRR